MQIGLHKFLSIYYVTIKKTIYMYYFSKSHDYLKMSCNYKYTWMILGIAKKFLQPRSHKNLTFLNLAKSFVNVLFFFVYREDNMSATHLSFCLVLGLLSSSLFRLVLSKLWLEMDPAPFPLVFFFFFFDKKYANFY